MSLDDLARCESEGLDFAKRASDADRAGRTSEALFYYSEAVDSLLAARRLGSQLSSLTDNLTNYLARAEQLKDAISATSSSPSKAESDENQQWRLAKFILGQAVDIESDQTVTDKAPALELYLNAIELFLKMTSTQTLNEDRRKKAEAMARNAIERAEALKKITGSQPVQKAVAFPSSTNLAFSKEEIHVLAATSKINGIKCLPYMPDDSRLERFAYPLPFTDNEVPNHGLNLSPQQRNRLSAWARPSELVIEPTIIGEVLSPFAVKQTVVSDCSFVASLVVAAQWERRFRKPLISCQIYPQDARGRPIYNPCGKYMIRLHLNGVWRKIIIDDKFPVDSSNRLLCSYSTNPSEFWVSLLEKAYIKVMGGYDFPGSNSSIDLNALTGWIPERVSIKSDVVDFDRDRQFNRLLEKFHSGACLVTVATGPLSQQEEERTGLVSTHAYAVVDIRRIDNLRLFMLKNPWSHLRWKGHFSENDSAAWTADMQRRLGYDRRSARLKDDGVFWIDYDSLCNFFEVFYLSWDSSLFPYRTCLHEAWPAVEGPRKDVYDMSRNPQFLLRVQTAEKAAIWLQLTRHIVDRDDFAVNREFVTLLVFKVDGRRVFYPSEPLPILDGVRINSPHYLTRLDHPAGQPVDYTVVVSQFDKANTLHFTLNVYASCPIQVRKMVQPYIPQYTIQVAGEWTSLNSGGCQNNRETYDKNPVFQLSIGTPSTSPTSTADVLVILRGPRQYAVGFSLFKSDGSSSSTDLARQAPTYSSGAFRHGFCYLELNKVQQSTYLLVPCTFNANQLGPFIFEIQSTVAVSLKLRK